MALSSVSQSGVMSENTPGSSGEQPEEQPQQADGHGAPGDTSGVPPRPDQQDGGQASQSEQAHQPGQAQESDRTREPGQAPSSYQHPGYEQYGSEQYGYEQPGPGQHGYQQANPYASDAYAGAWQNPYQQYTQPHGAPQESGQGAYYGSTMNAVHTPPAQRHRGRSRLVGGVVVLAVVVGAVGGGVGGVVGYELGHQNAQSPTVLDRPAPARTASTTPNGSVEQVAQKVLPSVVQLQTKSFSGGGEGSGIVLSSDGYILTNNHVVASAEQGGAGELNAQFHDGRSAPVKVVGSDPTSDLAVVKADVDGLQPADLGRSDDLPVGAPVVAIGSPFGLSGTVTSGILSAKDRPVRAGGERGPQDSVLNALQTDAAINPGNSGGPLVDQDGRVVGINSAIYSPGGSGQSQSGSVGLGFAIPIDQAKRIANELKNTGSATHSTLGVTIRSSPRQPGAVVVQSVPGGAAEQAGVRAGDVITRVNDRQIPDSDSLVAAVRSHNPGDRVAVTATPAGGGPPHTYQVTLQGQK